MWRQPLPASIERFQNSGGALEYSVFLGDCNGLETHRRAIDAHLTNAAIAADHDDTWTLPADQATYLQTLEERELTPEQFFGDSCDPVDRMLIRQGSGDVKGLGRLTNPRYGTLYGRKFGSWGFGVPGHKQAGQYAFAFAQPPYSLRMSLEETQSCFSAINDVILPAGEPAVIFDWSAKDLVPLDPYFEAGAEWWGMFLFTIHHPSLSQMIVISGSSTD